MYIGMNLYLPLNFSYRESTVYYYYARVIAVGTQDEPSYNQTTIFERSRIVLQHEIIINIIFER